MCAQALGRGPVLLTEADRAPSLPQCLSGGPWCPRPRPPTGTYLTTVSCVSAAGKFSARIPASGQPAQPSPTSTYRAAPSEGGSQSHGAEARRPDQSVEAGTSLLSCACSLTTNACSQRTARLEDTGHTEPGPEGRLRVYAFQEARKTEGDHVTQPLLPHIHPTSEAHPHRDMHTDAHSRTGHTGRTWEGLRTHRLGE